MHTSCNMWYTPIVTCDTRQLWHVKHSFVSGAECLSKIWGSGEEDLLLRPKNGVCTLWSSSCTLPKGFLWSGIFEGGWKDLAEHCCCCWGNFHRKVIFTQFILPSKAPMTPPSNEFILPDTQCAYTYIHSDELIWKGLTFYTHLNISLYGMDMTRDQKLHECWFQFNQTLGSR